MKLANFLNKIFKKDGFILIDADQKNYINSSFIAFNQPIEKLLKDFIR